MRETLERAVSEPAAVGEALRPTEGGFTLLHHAPDLTVLHVVWAPGMRIFPHDHQMWAAIGIYAGQEDNEFFRRAGADGRGLTGSGGRELAVGDVLLLGDDAIHAVTNPLSRLTGAIHVYAGDFVNEPRSQWGPGPVEERPYDIESAAPAVRRGQHRLAGPGKRSTAQTHDRVGRRRGATAATATSVGRRGAPTDVPGHPLLTRRVSARPRVVTRQDEPCRAGRQRARQGRTVLRPRGGEARHGFPLRT